MKNILIFIVFILLDKQFLYSQLLIKESKANLSQYQVNDLELIDNNLFILTQHESEVSIDLINTKSNDMINDIFKELNVQISAQANLTTLNNGNLFIGDWNKLLEYDLKNNIISNHFDSFEKEDSINYQISSITEDNTGNIYFNLHSVKNIYETKEGNTNVKAQVWQNYLYKFDGKDFIRLYHFNKGGFTNSEIFYFRGKIYFSIWQSKTFLYEYDIENNITNEFIIDTPIINNLDDWDKIEEFKLIKFYYLKNEIYTVFEIRTSIYNFKCLGKMNTYNNTFEYFTLDKNKEFGGVFSTISSYKINDKLIISTDILNDLDRKFYYFENDKFNQVSLNSNHEVDLITKKDYYNTLKNFNRLDFLSFHNIINRGVIIDNYGNLYGGGDKGLYKINSFQSTSNVDISSIPESIYPNPTSNIINIDIETPTNIELFDILGNKLLEDYNTKLDISHLSPGTYYIRYLGQTKMVVKL